MDTTNLSQYKVLVVDDEESQRILYAEYLSMEGFTVLQAADGQEALDKIEANPDITVVLLDLMMPKVDGIKVLERIRENPKTKNMSVYMMTVLNRDSVIKKAYDLDADGYLIKESITPADIKKEVLHAIESKTK
ncbi:MAG: response regulator [Niabella sp.]|nr:MAG: response regulator [Niabella sp.]